MTDPITSPSPATPPPRRGHRWLLGLLAALALVVLGLVAAAGWLWTRGDAQHQLLQAVPGLSIEGLKGRTNGGPLTIEHLRWQGAGLQVDIDGLRWQDLQWRWRPNDDAWLGLAIEQPQARAVRITRVPAATPPPSEPLQAPTRLRLPLTLSLQGLKVDSLQLDGQTLVTALAADVELGADAGASHRVDKLSLSRGNLTLTGSLRIGADGPLPLQADLHVATPSGNPMAWQATVKATGPLQQLAVDAQLRTEAGAGFSAKAGVTAFANWPLASLVLQAQDLDLASLANGLPETALSGSAQLGDTAAGQPLALQLALDNAKPGRWDAGRLPVRSLRGTLQGRTSEPDRVAFDGWVVELGERAGDGQLALSGRWQGSRLDLELGLQAVRTASLDTRAPPATTSGSLKLVLDGLAVPGSTDSTQPQPLQGTVTADLQGRLPPPTAGGKPPPPLAVTGDITFALPVDGSLSVDLKGFNASAGRAKTSAKLNAQRDAAGAWSLKTEGQLERVDLATWWPAAGPSDLNGRWKADVQVPVQPQPQAPATANQLLETLRGAVELGLEDSRLSGVALSGQVTAKAEGQGLALDANLKAGGNQLQLSGQTGAAGSTAAWRAELQAPALAALAPLLARVPAAQGWLPKAGQAQGSATASGRWPSLHTDGSLQIDDLHIADTQVAKGQVRWTFNGAALDAPLSLDADLSGLAQGERRLERLHASLAGSLREHQLKIDADSPLRPPAWTETAGAAAAAEAKPGSTLRLQGQGRWQPASAATTLGAGAWRGTLSTLQAGPRGSGAAPWLSAHDLVASVALDAQGLPTEAQLAPGRIEAFGGALAWQQAMWQAPAQAGGPARLTLQAQLEPLQLAPVLARLQPEYEWRGDLIVAGSASIRSGARFDADIVVERQGGDLGLTVAGSRRNLGLSALRLALSAHDGRWELTQAVNGSQVGVLAGGQLMNTAVDALWPAATTALEGGLSLRVDDAGVWAPWLPPGWRLSGELSAHAVIGGQFGAPTAKGTLTGEKLAARNIFEGVNLKDGSLRVTLDQSGAVVETLHFAGADGGSLDVTGRVAYANAPQVDLKLAADHFRALGRVDRRVTASGNADIGLKDGRLAVKGSFTIDEGLIDVTASDAPSHDDDVIIVGRKDAKGRPLPVTDGGQAAKNGVLAGTDIDVRVDLGKALRLRGSGLDTRLTGQLRLTSTEAGGLAARGVINTVDGTYTAYGQNLAIDRGVISFTGDLATPRLDILAIRADIDTRVGVVVSGSAVNPRVRLYSDPDLPEMDQLTWLLTGQAPQGQGRDQSALLQRAALALLAGDRGASSEGFLQRLGVDQLGVARTDGGDTVVTIGKQLSKRLSVAYEKGLAAAGGTWSLLYRIAGRTSVRLRTGVENALEVIWSWRWD